MCFLCEYTSSEGLNKQLQTCTHRWLYLQDLLEAHKKKASDLTVLMTPEWSCADLAKVTPKGSAMGSRHLALARRLPHRRVGSQRMMQSWKDMVIIRTQHGWWSEWRQRKRSKLWSLWLKPLCILCLSCHQRNLGSDGLIYVGKKIKSNSEDNKFLG